MADYVAKAKSTIRDVKSYWKVPPKGKYMTFKEIGAYAFGGIGAYFIIQLGSTLIVSTTNIIVSSAIGVGPKHTSRGADAVIDLQGDIAADIAV